jgi:hypothetical protein
MAKKNVVYQVKITLANVKPPIWRRVEVEDCSLLDLHEIIQVCMGWDGGHLWCFEIGGQQYGEDIGGDLEMQPAAKVRLSQLVRGGKKFKYVYDFGDNWEHLIQIEKVLEADPTVEYPRCVNGSRHGPPEDCGGPWGYADFLEAIQNPDHPEHEEMLDWVGGEFDPEAFDLDEVNEELDHLR